MANKNKLTQILTRYLKKKKKKDQDAMDGFFHVLFLLLLKESGN